MPAFTTRLTNTLLIAASSPKTRLGLRQRQDTRGQGSDLYFTQAGARTEAPLRAHSLPYVLGLIGVVIKSRRRLSQLKQSWQSSCDVTLSNSTVEVRRAQRSQYVTAVEAASIDWGFCILVWFSSGWDIIGSLVQSTWSRASCHPHTWSIVEHLVPQPLAITSIISQWRQIYVNGSSGRAQLRHGRIMKHA